MTHRYIGASGGCWELYAALHNGGEPPLFPAPTNALLVDAYAVQHPGTPSAQATQSVAVHLLTLYGVLRQGVGVDQALWLRRQAVRGDAPARHARYTWLTPPDLTGGLTVLDIVRGPDPAARTGLLHRYVQEVWARWEAAHGPTIARWYRQYVAG